MSDYAVCKFLGSRLEGLDIGLSANLEAIVTPVPNPFQTGGSTRLKAQTLTQSPRAFIWPSGISETLPTMSGPTGYRRAVYNPLIVELRNVYQPQDPNIDKWLAAVEVVRNQIRTTGLNIPLDKDGVAVPFGTTEICILTQIGLHIRTRQRRPAITSNRPFTAISTLECSAQEQITAIV